MSKSRLNYVEAISLRRIPELDRQRVPMPSRLIEGQRIVRVEASTKAHLGTMT